MRDHEPVPPSIEGLRPVSYLGSGGFGEVFLYEDVNTSARFALKVLREGSLAAGSTQLIQEAQALGRLSANGPHPNIVAVQRIGITGGGRPYLVMEYCPGGSWAQQIGMSGRIHPSKVLSVGIQIAGALHMAHRQGIVHRDIKPGNILIGARIGGQGIPKLGDFGIAALTADEVARGSVWMSVDYCAPEVLESGEADESADIFALAATLYHALAGRSWVRDPHGDNSPEAIEHRIRTSPVPPIGAHAPETLEALLVAAMSRDRRVRALTYPTAKEFALRLRDVEVELQYPPTPVPIEDDFEHTRQRRPAPVMPDPGEKLPQPSANGSSGGRDSVAQAETKLRGSGKPATTLEQRRWRVPVMWLAAAAVTAVAVTGVVLANTSSSPQGSPGSSRPPAKGDTAVPDIKPVPIPTVTATRIDATTVKFTWTYADPLEGDSFLVNRQGADAESVKSPEWTWKGAGPDVCVEVTVVRKDGRTTDRGGRDCD